MDALLDDLSSELEQGIANGRGKSVEEVRALIDGGPWTAKEALENGLVDGLMYPDEVEDQLDTVLDQRGLFVDSEYEELPDQSGWEPQRAVGVIVVDGAISEGESSSGGFLSGGGTGSDTVVRALDQARNTSAIKAVVLRVDSPGGSAFASDEIWRAVQRLKDQGKPVVVSMGGYAASGGYYISSGANAIYALPSTVTGSIGVYGGKISAQGLFERLHIETEQYNRARNASMYSTAAPFDDVQMAALDRMVGDTYRQFKEKVEAGRNLTADQVETVARGRVWSGKEAADKGLVDSFGGFFDAVERARLEAGLRPDAPYALVTYDGSGGGGEPPAQLVRAMFTPKVKLPDELEPLLSLTALRGERMFALMPYHLELH